MTIKDDLQKLEARLVDYIDFRISGLHNELLKEMDKRFNRIYITILATSTLVVTILGVLITYLAVFLTN